MLPSLRRRNTFARLNSTNGSPTTDEREEDDPDREEDLSALYENKLLLSFPRADVSKRVGRLKYKADRHRRLGRMRKERDAELAGLDLDTLGKATQVVVLPPRYVFPWQRRKWVPPEEPPEEQPEIECTTEEQSFPFLINDLAYDDGRPPSAPAVNEAIESMRSPYQQGQQLESADWEDLRLKIGASFSKGQVSHYISTHTVHPQGNALDTTSALTGSWVPGKSEFQQSAYGGLLHRLPALRDLPLRYQHAEILLRSCWQLEVMNEIGQIELTLARSWLFLLMHSKSFYLQELASIHEASVDVSFDLELLHITGTRHACESVRDIVQDVCSRICTEEVALVPAATSPDKVGRLLHSMSREFLDEVGRTYGVSVGRDEQSGLPKQIYYLAADRKHSDYARRTLSLAAVEAVNSRTPFYTNTSESGNTYPVDVGNNASWPLRREHWHRWSRPPAELTGKLFHEDHTTTDSREILSKLDFSSARNESEWKGRDVYQVLTATIGRCLFSSRNLSDGTTISASELNRPVNTETQMFSTDIPRVSHFLRFMSPFPAGTYEPTHLIQLIPSPAYSNDLPRLEFEISVGRARRGLNLNFTSARAVFGGQKVNYLLPECGLDVRFSRDTNRDLLSLRSSLVPGFLSSESFWQSIHNCIMQLFSDGGDIGSSQHPFWSIPVPKAILPQPPGVLNDSDDFIMGEYIVPPFEDIQDALIDHYDFYGERLSYRDYAAGPFLPSHTTDLFLTMAVPPSSKQTASAEGQPSTLEKEFHSFCKTACRLVYEVDAS